VRPASFNATISLGDIVRVELRRESTAGDVTLHNYLYEVERINRNISGSVELDLTHFPVNKDGQSLLAMYVLDAEGAGFELPTGRDNFQCDIPGRDEDETPLPLDPYTDPDLPPSSDFDYDLPDSPDFDPLPAPPGGGFGGTGGPGNPEDPLEEDIVPVIEGASGDDGRPILSDVLTMPDICPGMRTEWFLIPSDGGESIMVGSGVAASYLIGPEATGFSVFGRGCCPDPGAPEGFAACQQSETTLVAKGGELAVPGALLTDVFNWNILRNGVVTTGLVGGPVIQPFLQRTDNEIEPYTYRAVIITNTGGSVFLNNAGGIFADIFTLENIPTITFESGAISYTPPADWSDLD
jgi:hypothetical protein